MNALMPHREMGEDFIGLTRPDIKMIVTPSNWPSSCPPATWVAGYPALCLFQSSPVLQLLSKYRSKIVHKKKDF